MSKLTTLPQVLREIIKNTHDSEIIKLAEHGLLLCSKPNISSEFEKGLKNLEKAAAKIKQDIEAVIKSFKD